MWECQQPTQQLEALLFGHMTTARLERATYGLGNRCSILLSYVVGATVYPRHVPQGMQWPPQPVLMTFVAHPVIPRMKVRTMIVVYSAFFMI